MKLFDVLPAPLNEATLAANQMPGNKLSGVKNPKTGDPYTRQELFLVKVLQGSPFTLVSGEEVTIDPKEANKVKTWLQSGPRGFIQVQTTDGNTVSNTQIQKTVEFGSSERQKIAVKPSDVFSNTVDVDVETVGTNVDTMLQAGAFRAADMYEKLASNAQLKRMGKVGQAIVSMAGQLDQGQVATVPDGLSEEEVKAIELYATEFLGVLAVIKGVAQFEKRDAFLNGVGSDLSSLLLYFPKASNNPIADSYSLLNKQTGNALAISSKAAGKGAPPALTSLKMPEFLSRKYPDAYQFIRVAQTKGTGITQPMYLMNWIAQNIPDVLPEAWRNVVPFSESDMQAVQDSMKGKDVNIPDDILSAALSRLSPKVREGTATPGGKVFYSVISDVMKVVNAGAIPNFRECILTSLGFNFVQIYSNIKNGQLSVRAFWPAKVDGKVSLKSKSSAGADKGKISYQVSD